MKKISIRIEDKEEKKRILKIMKELKLDKLIIDSKKAPYKNNYKFVICDDKISEIKRHYNSNKIVIVYQKDKKDRRKNNSIYYEKRISTYTSENELREILSYHKRQAKLKSLIIKVIMIVLLLIVVTAALIFVNYKNRNYSKNKTNTTKNISIDYKKENIVFYGDSITNLYDLEKYYKNLPVINSGTGGFKVPDLLRLVEERVYIYNPTKVFILIGTNDIDYTDVTNEELVKSIEELIEKIKANRPKAKLYIESIYPVTNNPNKDIDSKKNSDKNKKNSRIKKINNLLSDMCKNHKVEYINIYKILANDDGDLIKDYTTDGLHISEKGYEVITKELMNYINPSQIKKNENG